MTLTPEWTAIGLTAVGMCFAALGTLVALVVKVGKVVSSLDQLGKEVEKLAGRVEDWQEKHNNHSERIASLEARACECGD